jgi:hypothetical protein
VASNIKNRELVVPWSIAPINWDLDSEAPFPGPSIFLLSFMSSVYVLRSMCVSGLSENIASLPSTYC